MSVLRVLRREENRSSHYENICVLCNPGVIENKKLSPPTANPSIYVGETARSLFERGKEHWKSFRNKQEDSHILKHHQLHHGGEGYPSFFLRPVKYFKTSLTRQIAEAVLIQRWGKDVVLNSKAEYNRCKISRLTLGEDGAENKELEKEKEEQEQSGDESKTNTSDSMENWERTKLTTRRTQEVAMSIDLGRGITTPPSRKRLNKENKLQKPSKKKSKKLQHPVLSTYWGLEEEITETQNQDPPPPSSPPQ